MEKEEIRNKVSEWIEKSHASMVEDLERVINEQSYIFEDMMNKDVDLARVIMCALLKEQAFQFSPIHKTLREALLIENIFGCL